MWWAKIVLPGLTAQKRENQNAKIKIGHIPKIKTENHVTMLNRFAILWCTVCLVSCNSNTLVSETYKLPGYWDKNDVVEFTIPKMDSVQKYNIFLNLRNTNEYPYNNIFIIANMTFPHGKVLTDTLEYRMAQPDGKWLGQGLGDVKDNKLWYKENVVFFEGGNYKITLSQAVRNNGKAEGVTRLDGLTDVGYSIENSENQ